MRFSTLTSDGELPHHTGNPAARRPATGMLALKIASAAALCATVICLLGAAFDASSPRPSDLEMTDPVAAALSAHALASSYRGRIHALKTFDPVTAALQAHGEVPSRTESILASTKASKAELRAKALKALAWKAAIEKGREEHPWDDIPEGLPQSDGSIVPAADFVDGAGQRDLGAVQQQPHQQAAPVHQAARQIAAATTAHDAVDPSAEWGLESAITDHEDDGRAAPPHERASAHQRGSRREQESGGEEPLGPRSTIAKGPGAGPSAAGAGSGQGGAGQGSHQGFVTGSPLRVTPEEFHREMRRYLPSSTGKLISPFEWFQTGGKGFPDPAPKAKPSHRSR